jgi:hypothetical protein
VIRARARIIAGKARNKSMTRAKISSILPPQYAEKQPTAVPTTNVRRIVLTAIKSEVWSPQMVLEKRSLPR